MAAQPITVRIIGNDGNGKRAEGELLLVVTAKASIGTRYLPPSYARAGQPLYVDLSTGFVSDSTFYISQVGLPDGM